MLPWLIENNKYLFFSYVHLLKNICNLWLTEKTEQIFDYNGVKQVIEWAHLKQLYHIESERLVTFLDLDKISITPNLIKRQ